MLTIDHTIVGIVTLLVVIIAVMLHYEASVFLSRLMSHTKRSNRKRILILVFGLLIAHVAEIWLFGITSWLLHFNEGTGVLIGQHPVGLLDYIYLSATTYTTLGYGDVVPTGPIRAMYGTESLTGFVLITWSASLTFLEMQKHWASAIK